jgi:hypothetical protein
MPNRVYTNLTKLRTEVEKLIDQGRVRVLRHARETHPELTEIEQIAIVRYGGPIQRDKTRDPAEGVYVCWGGLASVGPYRAVFCVSNESEADVVLIITAFQEE